MIIDNDSSPIAQLLEVQRHLCTEGLAHKLSTVSESTPQVDLTNLATLGTCLYL